MSNLKFIGLNFLKKIYQWLDSAKKLQDSSIEQYKKKSAALAKELFLRKIVSKKF
jgi:hypothetical protein